MKLIFNLVSDDGLWLAFDAIVKKSKKERKIIVPEMCTGTQYVMLVDHIAGSMLLLFFIQDTKRWKNWKLKQRNKEQDFFLRFKFYLKDFC